MEFTPQEMRMVETLRRKQKFSRGLIWKRGRWLSALVGLCLLGVGAWLLNWGKDILTTDWPKISANDYQRHLDSLTPDERQKWLEANVLWLSRTTSGTAQLLVGGGIYLLAGTAILIGIVYMTVLTINWRENPREALLLKLIDERQKPAPKPPEPPA